MVKSQSVSEKSSSVGWTTEQPTKPSRSIEQWGDIVDVVVMKGPKRSRGFGFITYSHCYMVDDAQSARPLMGEQWTPREPFPEPGATVKKIFLGGMKYKLGEEELEGYFGEFGVVASVAIMDRETGKKRGFRFVEFDDYDTVDEVCLQGSPHDQWKADRRAKKAIGKIPDRTHFII